MFLNFFQSIPFSFAALFPVLNPLGTAVIFLSLTMGATQQQLKTVARKVAINTWILLTVVVLTGSWILRFFGITIPIVQVGGGFVLAFLAWNLLNAPANPRKKEQGILKDNREINEMVFFPLTMPLTAGPGSIAVALTIGAHQISPHFQETVSGELGAIVGILLASVTVYLGYAYAGYLMEKLGESGMQVIVRLSAFINLCIGLSIVWQGIQGLISGG